MRNGMVAALYAEDGDDALLRLLDYTVLHGIITHYGPLPVLTCVLHSLLIRYRISAITWRMKHFMVLHVQGSDAV